MKRSPLDRGKPLERKRPAKAREVPLATTKSVRAEGRSNPRPRRDTGPTPETRRLVWERARSCCERCGKPVVRQFGVYSIHHRKPRGMGGTRDESVNSPSNLVLLCGSATSPDGCHTGVERFRASAVATGYIVPQAGNPETVPIKIHDFERRNASGWFLLRSDGTKVPTTRLEEADG